MRPCIGRPPSRSDYCPALPLRPFSPVTFCSSPVIHIRAPRSVCLCHAHPARVHRWDEHPARLPRRGPRTPVPLFFQATPSSPRTEVHVCLPAEEQDNEEMQSVR